MWNVFRVAVSVVAVILDLSSTQTSILSNGFWEESVCIFFQ